MTQQRPVEVGTIATMLNDRIDVLVCELLPAGRQDGAEYCVGDVTGAPGDSLRVRLTGAKAGVWKDFGLDALPEHQGDALDLVAQVRFRGDKKLAIRWARGWLGLDAIDPNSIPAMQAEALQKRARRQEDASAAARKMRGRAQQLFLEALPFGNSPSEAYSLARGIDWRSLGHYPGSLRHHPGCWNVEAQRKLPCLLQAVVAADGAFLTVHRTWLERGRDGVWRKAPLADPKMTYSPYAGGCVHLWKGASGKRWAEAVPGEELVIGEGYEDVGTAVTACPEYRAAVAVSGSNMAGLVLPAAIKGVILLQQNEDNAAASSGWDRTIAAYHDRGLGVRVVDLPPAVKDINELQMMSRGDGRPDDLQGRVRA